MQHAHLLYIFLWFHAIIIIISEVKENSKSKIWCIFCVRQEVCLPNSRAIR